MLAWIASRAALLGIIIGWLPYPDGPLVINDVLLYSEWSQLLVTGRFPIGDDMWQYPPGAGAVFALSALIGASPVIGFFVIALATDAAILVMLLVAGAKSAKIRAFNSVTATTRPAWIWVISALLIGPVFLARFDLLPTAAAVAALLLITHPRLSGAAAAVGTLLKIWPGLTLLALPRRSLVCGATGFVVAAIAILMAVSLWATGGVSFVGEQQSRGLQVESVAAWPFLIAQGSGATIPLEFRFGAMEIDLAVTVGIGTVVTGLGLILIAGLGLARLLGMLEDIPGVDVVLTALLISMVTSRVLSPQYNVWLAGIAAVALMDPRTRLRPVIGLLAISVTVTQVIYPFGYGSLLSGQWWALGLHSVRILSLVAATIWALTVLIGQLRAPSRRDRDPRPQNEPGSNDSAGDSAETGVQTSAGDSSSDYDDPKVRQLPRST